MEAAGVELYKADFVKSLWRECSGNNTSSITYFASSSFPRVSPRVHPNPRWSWQTAWHGGKVGLLVGPDFNESGAGLGLFTRTHKAGVGQPHERD